LVSFDALSSGVTSRVAHAATGIAVMCLGRLQPLNALIRPPKSHHGQPPTAACRVWRVAQVAAGWLAIGLSVVTIILGTTLAPGASSDRARFQFGYGAAVVCVVLLAGFSLCDHESNRRSKGGAAARIPQEQHMADMKGKEAEVA
jgi:hypothetical protein